MRWCPTLPDRACAGAGRLRLRHQQRLRVQQLVDTPGARLLHEVERRRALQQARLPLAPRIEGALDRREDVPDSHAAQPGHVLGRVVRRVEDPVVDGVRLAIPAPRDGIAGLGEVERLPVPAQRDHVEAVVGVVELPRRRQSRSEVGARGLRALDGVEEVARGRTDLQQRERHDGDDGEVAVAERRPQPRVAQQQEQRQAEDHEEPADVVAQRAPRGDERPHAERRVHQEQDDEGPARVRGVDAGQAEPDEREAEVHHEL